MYRFLVLLVSCLVLPASLSLAEEDYHTRGWVEHARILPDRLLMSAKLDSGARTTSIHAEILPIDIAEDKVEESELFRWLADQESDAVAMFSMKMIDGLVPDDPPADDIEAMESALMDGEMPETVTFRLTSRGGKEGIYTAPVVRWVSIRRRGGGSIVRPVVMMDMCIAGRRVQGEVNLADRSGFNYPLLIGRNMLRDAAISIDSRQIFASKRACPKGE
ncbi:MAG: RimK/LysX family protein [Pseudomonadota bacterium]